MTADEASSAKDHDEARTPYSTVLLLSPPTPNTLLIKWASMVLIRGSANDALIAANEVCFP